MAFTEEGLFLMSSYAAYYEFGTTIVLDDFKNVRRTVSVMTEDLIATGLEENMPIDEEAYAILAAGCETYEAAARGINLLGYSDKSKRAMALALHRKGFDKDISVRAADVLEEYGYIDEVRQIERRAEVMIRKKYGKSRIMSDLHVKGYDLSRVDEWVSGESFQSIDFGALCLKFRPLQVNIAWFLHQKQLKIPPLIPNAKSGTKGNTTTNSPSPKKYAGLHKSKPASVKQMESVKVLYK